MPFTREATSIACRHGAPGASREIAMAIGVSTRKAGVMALLLLAGCASMFSVSSQQYPKADFSGYRSYAWIAEDPQIRPPGEGQQVSAMTARSIREAIESGLASRGYQPAMGAAKADFVVAYTVGARDRIDAQSYPMPYRGPWLWEWYGSQTDLRVYREGTLSIDIFDGTTHQPVWHGRARKEITRADESNPGPVIRRAVDAILAKFPKRR
jgi:hypothetical protein